MRRVMKDPRKPPKAAADATARARRQPDNILPTMDEHGVEDIVRNLGHGTEADQREREQRASQRPLTNEFSADTYGSSKRPGEEDAAHAVGAPSDQGLRGSRINNEGEGGPVTQMVRGERQVAARTSVSPPVPAVPRRNRGVEDALNQGAKDLNDQIAHRSERVKKRRSRPD